MRACSTISIWRPCRSTRLTVRICGKHAASRISACTPVPLSRRGKADLFPAQEKGEEAMVRLFARVVLAMCLAVAAGFNVQAQTKPKVTTLGPDFPKATLFV